MMSAYVTLVYGLMIGYGIRAILGHANAKKYDWWILIGIYFVLVLLGSQVN